eukprot:868945-Prorocentrum_minimum.AAC.4
MDSGSTSPRRDKENAAVKVDNNKGMPDKSYPGADVIRKPIDKSTTGSNPIRAASDSPAGGKARVEAHSELQSGRDVGASGADALCGKLNAVTILDDERTTDANLGSDGSVASPDGGSAASTPAIGRTLSFSGALDSSRKGSPTDSVASPTPSLDGWSEIPRMADLNLNESTPSAKSDEGKPKRGTEADSSNLPIRI